MMYNPLLKAYGYIKSINLKWIALVISLLFIVSESKAQNRISRTMITTSFENANFSDVIRTIESNTDFKFVYQAELVNQKNKLVDLTLENKSWSVGALLVKVGKLANVSFKQTNNNITIKDNEIDNTKAQGEPIKISGIVTDDTGEPLPGVNIIEVGTLNGVSTDFNGEYTIKASYNGVLEFSYLGFTTKKRDIEYNSVINVQMTPSSAVLSEVVITGYQTLSSERTTGSFGVVKEVQIQNQVEESLTGRLNGLTAGLIVDKSSDGSDKITIRGQSTFGSNTQPLIVVDGLPIEGGMESIEPNDVKSMSVLKDASAASIWGTRASNGVIVIETKSAQKIEGKSQVTINFSTTVGDMYDISDLQLANSTELIDYEWYANKKNVVNRTLLNSNHFAISPVTQLYLDKPSNITNQLNALRQLDATSQMEDHLMQRSILNQADIFVQTASEKNVFSVSLNGKSNRSNFVGSGNDQFNLNLKNAFNLAKKLDFNIGVNANFRENKSNGISASAVANRKPYELLMDDNGNRLPQSFGWHQKFIDRYQYDEGYLPWNYNLLNEVDNKDVTSKALIMRVNASIKYEPIEGLNLTASFLLEDAKRNSRNLATEKVYSTVNLINQYTLINPVTGEHNFQFPRGSILRESSNPYNSYTIRGVANYKKTFLNDDLRMNLLAGYEMREFAQSSISNVYAGYNDQAQNYQDLTYTDIIFGKDENGDPIEIDRINNKFLTGQVDQFFGNAITAFPSASFRSNFNWQKDRHRSYFGNFNFTYKNKYTLTGSARVDKASLFGVAERYKNNPLWSVGGKWNIGQEEFNPDILDRLEFRVSYGFTGNINKDFASYATAEYLRNPFTQVDYLQLRTPKNDDLSFEKTSTFNAGIDFALQNNIIGGSIEFFTKNSVDLLGSVPVDPASGWSSINANYGSMLNTGVEIELNSTMINTDNVRWSAGINFTNIKNEVTNVVSAFENANFFLNGGTSGAREGFPFSAMHNFRDAGLNQYGNYQYEAADGTIYTGADASAMVFEDLVYSGQTAPKYYGGFNTNVSYKDFSLDVLLTYKGGYVSRKPMVNYNVAVGTGNTHQSIANAWTQPGDELNDGVLPTYVNEELGGGAVYTSRTRWNQLIFRNDSHFFDASHMRLKNVRLSYNTPFGTKKQFNLQVFALAQNLAVITKNKLGIDPDFINPYTGQLRFTDPKSFALGFSVRL